MPNYYTGADPTQAFSGGLMAGYEFIDRIRARAEQMRQQKLQEERDTERLGMQKQEFALNQEVGQFNLGQARKGAEEHEVDRKHVLERQPIVEKQQDDESRARLRAQGLTADEIEMQIKAQKDLIRGRDAVGKLIDSQGAADDGSPPTLGQIGAQGARVGEGTVLKPGVQGQEPPAAQAPAPAAAAPVVPMDLRALQQEQDAQPNIFKRGFEAVKTSLAEGQARAAARDASGAWSEIANPKVSGKGRVYGGGLESVAIRDVRLNPEKYADVYARDRDKVDPKDRPTLDNTMLSAAQRAYEDAIAQQKQLDPKDPNIKVKSQSLINQQIRARDTLDTLNKGIAKDKAHALLPNGGTTSADNPNVLAAVTQGKQQQDASGVIPKVTEQSLRLTQTQLGRMDNPARLNKQQLGWLSEAFRTGAIDLTTYTNWRRYGGPLAPPKPQIIPFGNGKGVVLYPTGQLAEIDVGAGKGKGGSGAGGATFNQSLEFMKDTLNSRIKAGVLDAKPGTGANEMGKMMLLLQRHAAQFQQQNPEVELLDSNGEMTMEWAKNPLDALKVMNWYQNVVGGADEPDEAVDPIPDSKSAARIIPSTPRVQ